LLPTEAPTGGIQPVYEEYAVVSNEVRSAGPVPSNQLGGRRIVYDYANDRVFYTNDIHAERPVFVELVN
jgi:hypothetical protein